MRVCVCVWFRDSDMGSQDKYKLKWAVPVKEVEVVGGAVKSHYLVHSRHGWTVTTPLDTSTHTPCIYFTSARVLIHTGCKHSEIGIVI